MCISCAIFRTRLSFNEFLPLFLLCFLLLHPTVQVVQKHLFRQGRSLPQGQQFQHLVFFTR